MQGKRDDFRQGTPRVELSQYQKKAKELDIDRESMNELVMNYLQIEGFKEAAAAFRDEADVTAGNLESITERVDVRKHLQSGDVKKAKDKVEEHFPGVLEDEELAFRFKFQELIELIKQGDSDGALQYATDNISSEELSTQNLEQLENTLCLLAFEDPSKCKYSSLLDPAQRAQTASSVNSAILRESSQDPTPQLQLVMRLLYWIESKLQEDLQFPHVDEAIRPPYDPDDEEL